MNLSYILKKVRLTDKDDASDGTYSDGYCR